MAEPKKKGALDAAGTARGLGQAPRGAGAAAEAAPAGGTNGPGRKVLVEPSSCRAGEWRLGDAFKASHLVWWLPAGAGGRHPHNEVCNAAARCCLVSGRW